MNDDIAMNELSLENTSPRSRPSNLAIRYQEMETVEWLAAKEELDSDHSSSCGKELVVQYLCDVFVVAEGQVSNQSVELTDIQQDLQTKVQDIIKGRSDKCNIDNIVKRVEECMKNKERYRRHIGTTASSSATRTSLETYMSECCRLAWQMNVQTPAMAISVQTDIPFDPALHERAYDCESFGHAAEVIDYYAWPTLQRATYHPNLVNLPCPDHEISKPEVQLQYHNKPPGRPNLISSTSHVQVQVRTCT
ncbi:hypothetical protein Bbelb_370360 [Branchiostoma belcheri]|nr:hypothetical protein Bbelb_370360 [Branchiostoma belcheri]